MKRLLRIAFQALAIVFVTSIAHGQIADAVDPFLGASGGGNVFPGPAVPFGMIKPGPDMINLHHGDPNAGWNAKGDIAGFSQTHVSGTGGGAKYGNIMVQPTTGAPAPLDSASPRVDEHASVGLYSVALSRFAVHVDLTASRRAAMYRFQFSGDAAGNLLFDVSHCLKSSGSEEQSVVTSEARVISPTAVAGSTSVTGGWNKQPNTYTVYFYAVTDTRLATSRTRALTDRAR